MAGRDADPASRTEEQRAPVASRQRIRDQGAHKAAEDPRDDDQDDVEVTGGGEHSGDRHDHLAREGQAAAVDDHQREHDEDAPTRDPLADHAAHRRGLWPTLPRTCAARSVQHRSRPGRCPSIRGRSSTGDGPSTRAGCSASTSTNPTMERAGDSRSSPGSCDGCENSSRPLRRGFSTPGAVPACMRCRWRASVMT